jgi:hypothetical protein
MRNRPLARPRRQRRPPLTEMVARIFPPIPGLRRWTVPRINARAPLAADHGDGARAEELDNLRLALATFAVQLDVFEMRTNKASHRNGITLPPPAIGRQHHMENDWWSIRSLGSKPDS